VAKKPNSNETAVKVIETEIYDRQELERVNKEQDDLIKTQRELIDRQQKSVELLTTEFIRASVLLNQSLSTIQSDGFKIRNAGATLEKFLNDNQDLFIKLILMGKKMGENKPQP
jgi:uncharacterized protein YjgD (DUF1641 family)